MSKQLIIAAFPQAAMKFCIYEDNKVTDEKQCWQPDANLTLALYLNKYSHLDKIIILGPQVYTEKIKADIVADKFGKLPEIELREV